MARSSLLTDLLLAHTCFELVGIWSFARPLVLDAARVK